MIPDDFGRFSGIPSILVKFRGFLPEIPDFVDPFPEFWWDLALPRRSVLKKAARGCPRIQIWSHEGPNQSQNHVFERSRCQPGKGKGKRQQEEKGKGKGQTVKFFPGSD